jgi:hemerythrin superfamily protein
MLAAGGIGLAMSVRAVTHLRKEESMKSQSRTKSQDAISLLTEDHKRVQKLFKEFEKLTKQDTDDGKDDLAQMICAELTVHAQIEEEILYPAASEVLEESDLIDEAEVEHASAKDLIEQIESMQAGDELFDARVTVLGEYVNHHIKEEQDEMFPKLKKSDLDLEILGEQLQERKSELMADMGMGELLKESGSMQSRSKRSKDTHKSSTRSH